MTDKEDFYGENSALYAEPSIRPVYPAELFELIYAFAGFRSGTALDVATGTGQCAQVLAETFSQVFVLSLKHPTSCCANLARRLCLNVGQKVYEPEEIVCRFWQLTPVQSSCNSARPTPR